MVESGAEPPVLVGGAVVELDTLSAITSGDLDVVSAQDAVLGRALEAVGFRREDRAQRRLGGWYHPTVPIAVDCVSSHYYDGRGDRRRLRVVALPSGEVLMAPIEEIVIDRIGQWEASDRRYGDVRAQIAALLLLAPALDDAYIQRRVAEEGGFEVDLVALRQPGVSS